VIEVLTPSRFDRVTMRGETKPMFATCEKENGDSVEVVLKAAGHVPAGINALAVEWVLANLATDLGLRVCKPFLVRLDALSLKDVHDREWALKAGAGNPVAFGSRVAGSNDSNGGFDQWTPSYVPSGPWLDQAWHTAAFDGWTDNIDRHPGNANCLVRGDEFRLIDHEKCFTALALHLFGPKPPKTWELGGLAHIMTPQKHIFAQCLKGRPMPRAAIRDAWCALPATHFNDYGVGLPPEWTQAVPMIHNVASAIVDIQTNIDACLDELERCLS
jgi:hypothetical protein